MVDDQTAAGGVGSLGVSTTSGNGYGGGETDAVFSHDYNKPVSYAGGINDEVYRPFQSISNYIYHYVHHTPPIDSRTIRTFLILVLFFFLIFSVVVFFLLILSE